jgi:hypothetical protein
MEVRQMSEDRRMIVSYDEIVKSTNTGHSGRACAGLGPNLMVQILNNSFPDGFYSVKENMT